MRRAHVRCPACNGDLIITAEEGAYKIRCGRCQHKFAVRMRLQRVSDEEIADWLAAGRPRDMDEQPAEDLSSSVTLPGISAASQPEPAASAHDSIAEAVDTGEPIRLLRITGRGALLQFRASRLSEPGFRCALPRECLRCGSRHHLQAHVVIFAPHLRDSISLEAERKTGPLRVSEEDVRTLSCAQVLQRLGRVPNVPPPADRPMPYWLCDMCSGEAEIYGQVHVQSDTGKGWCRLLLRNLRVAEAFVAAVGGKDSPGHRKLCHRIEAVQERPWDHLPEVVQNRLAQWYRPETGERFLTYVPDRDRGRSEDGMAGLVVSDRRLIHHCDLRHRESFVTQPLELELSTGQGRNRLRVKTPNWELEQFSLDRLGLARLRRSLSVAKFKAKWR